MTRGRERGLRCYSLVGHVRASIRGRLHREERNRRVKKQKGVSYFAQADDVRNPLRFGAYSCDMKRYVFANLSMLSPASVRRCH